MGSHKGRAEGQNPFSSPADHIALDVALEITGLQGCKCALLGHVQPFIQQHVQVLGRTALDPFIFQALLIPGVALSQAQHLALGLVQFNEVLIGHFSGLSRSLWMASHLSGMSIQHLASCSLQWLSVHSMPQFILLMKTLNNTDPNMDTPGKPLFHHVCQKTGLSRTLPSGHKCPSNSSSIELFTHRIHFSSL